MLAVLLCSFVTLGRSARAQTPPDGRGASPQVWVAADIGGASLGVAPEASGWYTGHHVALGLRWSKTVKWGEGTGDEHELAALAGSYLALGPIKLVLAAGVARAAGCRSLGEQAGACEPLRAETASALGADAVLPITRYVGVDVAAFGVRGERIRYQGLSVGFAVGRLR